MKTGWRWLPAWGRAAIAAAVALAMVWVGSFLWFVSLLPRPAAETTMTAQGIVVLTGGRNRIDAGLVLLNEGRGARLFISGANQGSSSPIIRSLRERSPKYDCCIEVGFEALDTAGNATETAAWVGREGLASLLVVTANYHMPRGLIELRRAMPDVILVPYPVFSESVRLDAWWRSPGTARVIAQEATKYWFAALRSLIVPSLASVPPPT
jgi:uncharacterized SAM-binding protein YcdF (DUF218 family)